MDKNNEILQELAALKSTLGSLPRTLPYCVPDYYFETLPETLAAKTLAQLNPTTALPQGIKVPYEVPEGYFQQLPETLWHLNRSIEHSPDAASEANLPEGYFEQLPQRLYQFVQEQEQKTRVTFSWGVFKKIRLAAAALLLLSLSLGGFHYWQQYSSADASANRRLSKVNPEEIANYVDQHLDEFENENLESFTTTLNPDYDTKMSQIDAASIEEYLNSTTKPDTKSLN